MIDKVLLVKYRLEDIGTIITGKTPSTKTAENFGREIPFVTPRDFVGQRYIESTERYLSEKGATSVRSSIIPPNAVMVTCIGSDMGKVALSKKKCVANQQVNSLLVSKAHDPLFIYYALSLKQEELKSSASGSALPILNKSSFGRFEIDLPPLETQREIAHILGTLDDKIELNRRMCKTLEEIAQTLFKHWFIDFEFPNEQGKPYKSSGGEMVDSELGPIPKGWKVGTLCDIAYLADKQIDPCEAHDAKYIGLEHINRSTFSLNGYGFASDAASSKRVFVKGDILFGKLRPYFRKVIVAPFNGICSTDIWVVKSISEALRPYLFQVISSKAFIDYVSKASEGSRMPRAIWAVASQFTFCFPPTPVVSAYSKIIENYIDMKQVLYAQSEELAGLLGNIGEIVFTLASKRGPGKDSSCYP